MMNTKNNTLKYMLSFGQKKVNKLNKGLTYFVLIFIFHFGLALLLGQNSLFAQEQSPMNSGQWAKISFRKSGLYVLDSQDIKSLGLTDLSKVCVWGYGGALMPEVIGEVEGHKVEQIPTLLKDGKLYFYIDGLTSWDYNAKEDFFHHRTNHYTNKAYLLLSQGSEGSKPLRMEQEKVELSTEPATADSRQYIRTLVNDFNSTSISHSGRRLYDKQLVQKVSYSHPLGKAKSLRMSLAYMAYPKKRGSQDLIDVAINDKAYFQTKITRRDVSLQNSAFSYGFFGMDKLVYEKKVFTLPTNAKQLTVSFSPEKPINTTHINYYELNLLEELTALKGQVTLRRKPNNPANKGNYTHYTLPKTSGLQVFALDRDHYFGAVRTKQIVAPSSKGQTMELMLKVKDELDAPRSYLALPLSSAYKPKLEGSVKKQNILGDKRQLNLVMIYIKALKAEAELLQKHYESRGQKCVLWSQEEVFNAFNGGTPDAMAYRLLAKHYYDNYQSSSEGTTSTSSTDEQSTPLSLLLFGDAAGDNRKISSDWQTKNLLEQDFLLSYQSVNSLDLSSYASDDIFGVLKDDGLSTTYRIQGNKRRSIDFEADYIPNLAKELMTISVGRLPVRTRDEAKDVVDKIIAYDTDDSYGAWKMRAIFVADNGDRNTHTKQSIEITERLESLAPALQISKIYMPAYMREISGGRATIPKAQKDFFEALEKGAMLVNYNGHGSPNVWTDENILTFADVKSFDYKHLPLWITATCDFSPFDVANTSAGESILLHPTSGGIALLSTTRVVWDIPNKMLNKALIEELFTAQKDGSHLRLGEAIRRAKNRMRKKSTPENRLNFVLLGSPLQQLVLPKNRVVLNKVHEKKIEEKQVVEIHALDKVKLSGYIRKDGEAIDGDFQGKMDVLVYDGEDEIETIDNFWGNGRPAPAVKYKDFLNLIYTSTIDIKDGQYSFEFTVPKDVAYSGKRGKISFYAYDPNSKDEVIGYARNLLIKEGGKQDDNQDKQAPQILEMKLSHKPIKNGMLVPEITEFYALVKEDTGLNLSSAGLGHQMTLNIDGVKGFNIDLSPYYSSSSEQKDLGIIKAVLPKLTTGIHHAELRICDVYNNVTIKTFDFIVREGLAPKIEELKVSPAKGGMLIVKHNQPAMPLIADIEIYDLSGKMVLAKKELTLVASSGYVAYPLDRLGLGEWKNLPKEVYILRLSLRAKGKNSALGFKAVKFFKP